MNLSVFRIASAWFLCLLVAGASAFAQKAAAPTRDTVFNEIELSTEGVTAVDTAGNHWIYNFDSAQFVPDKTTPATTRRGEGFGREATAAPVEDRCVNEKIVKPLQKSVLVGYDEYVDGGIIAYGRVTIRGWVKGDVQSVSGRVLVTKWGQVDGDIRAPEISVEEGAAVKGSQIITDALDFPTQVLARPFSADGLMIVLAFMIALVVIAFIVIGLLPRQYAHMRDCVVQFKARSMFIGILFIFLSPLIVVLVAITIIGVALLPFVPIAYAVAMAVGVIAVGNLIGTFIFGRLAKGRGGALIQAIAGTLIFMLQWVLVALLLGSSSSVARGFGTAALVISILISSYPVLGGIGAAFLTRFGRRPHTGRMLSFTRGKASEAPAPAPPPIPEMPGYMAPPPMPPRPSSQEPPTSPNRPGSLGPDLKPPLSADNS